MDVVEPISAAEANYLMCMTFGDHCSSVIFIEEKVKVGYFPTFVFFCSYS